MKTTLATLLSLCALALIAQDVADTASATNFAALAQEQTALAETEKEATSAETAKDAVPEETAEETPSEPAPAQDPEQVSPPKTEEPAQDVDTAAAAAEPAGQAEPEPTGQGISASTIQEEGVDEIDLEEDDSAVAARKPQIKGEISEGTTSLVDIECDEATLADILRQFRKTTGANIISDDSTNLQRRVSVSLRHVPWLQGMTAILSSRGFRLEVHDNIYRVVEDLQAIPVSTRTFQLNHASAKELADLFNATYAPKDQTGRVRTPIASSFAGANVVVVTASDKVISDCESIINAVDKAVAQIYIEARFIELSNEALHKLGMQWNSLESWGASMRNLSGGWEYNNGRSAYYGTRLTTRTLTDSTTDSNTTSANTSLSGGNTSSTASSSSSPSKTSSDSKTYSSLLPNSIGAAVGAGRDAASMAWHNARGFQGQLSVDDFRLALSAFETMSDAKVFSNPKIIVSNGKEAKVDMTTKYPNVTIDSNYTGQNSQNLSISTKLDTIPGEDKFMFAKEAFFSWGIELSVTPRISPDGLISVEIVPTISDCTGYLTVNSSQQTDTPYTQYPIIEVKRLTTEFTMKDGATAVIGGLSKTTEEDVDSGIPYLRKIPYIGPKLFGWKSRGKVQKEILVFVTVGIADPSNLPQDVGLPKNAIIGREFVRGNQFEPGDRVSASPAVLQLDLKPLDERDEQPRGEVRITPVAEK